MPGQNFDRNAFFEEDRRHAKACLHDSDGIRDRFDDLERLPQILTMLPASKINARRTSLRSILAALSPLSVLVVLWGIGCNDASTSPPASEAGDAPTHGGAGPTGANDRASAERELAALREKVERLVAQSLGCSEDGECVTLAFGSKPCGGAWKYLPYSPASDAAEDVRTAATELAQAETEYNSTYEVQSDCALEEEPTVACSSGKCGALP